MKLTSAAPFPLPESYINLLANSDGGEGPLCVQPDWLILYSAEEVTEIETSETFNGFFPGYFVIGGNGGGEAIALTQDKDGNEKVVFFDMANIDLEENVEELAPSFEELISLIEDLED